MGKQIKQTESIVSNTKMATTESMLNTVLADICASPPTDSSSTEVVYAFSTKVVTTLTIMQALVENLSDKFVEEFVGKFEAMLDGIPIMVMINMLNETMVKDMVNTFAVMIDNRFKKMMPDDVNIKSMRDEAYENFVVDCVWDVSKLKSTYKKILQRIEEIKRQ